MANLQTGEAAGALAIDQYGAVPPHEYSTPIHPALKTRLARRHSTPPPSTSSPPPPSTSSPLLSSPTTRPHHPTIRPGSALGASNAAPGNVADDTPVVQVTSATSGYERAGVLWMRCVSAETRHSEWWCSERWW